MFAWFEASKRVESVEHGMVWIWGLWGNNHENFNAFKINSRNQEKLILYRFTGSDVCLVRAIQESGIIFAWIKGLRNNNEVRHEAIRKDSVNHPPQTLQKPRTICFLVVTFYQRPKIRLQRKKGFDLIKQNMFRNHKEFQGKKNESIQAPGQGIWSNVDLCYLHCEGGRSESYKDRKKSKHIPAMGAAVGQLVWI